MLKQMPLALAKAVAKVNRDLRLATPAHDNFVRYTSRRTRHQLEGTFGYPRSIELWIKEVVDAAKAKGHYKNGEPYMMTEDEIGLLASYVAEAEIFVEKKNLEASLRAQQELPLGFASPKDSGPSGDDVELVEETAVDCPECQRAIYDATTRALGAIFGSALPIKVVRL